MPPPPPPSPHGGRGALPFDGGLPYVRVFLLFLPSRSFVFSGGGGGKEENMLTIKRVATVLSNYQEEEEEDIDSEIIVGCGKKCLGKCCLPGTPFFVRSHQF